MCLRRRNGPRACISNRWGNGDGVSFGFRYRIVGSRRGDPVSLTVTRFPAEGLRDPARNGTYYRNEILSRWKIGDEAGATFTFDAPWEAVPQLVIELWHGDRKLAEQSFQRVSALASVILVKQIISRRWPRGRRRSRNVDRVHGYGRSGLWQVGDRDRRRCIGPRRHARHSAGLGLPG